MGEGSYITLFSLSDVTAFHRMKNGGGGCYITLFSPSDVTAFHRLIPKKVPGRETQWGLVYYICALHATFFNLRVSAMTMQSSLML